MIDRTRLPFGGENIFALRLQKRKPERVVVSLLPLSVKIDVDPFALVRAIPGKDYEWRFLAQLDVTIVCTQGRQSLKTIDDLAPLCKLSIWLIDERRGCDVSRLPDPKTVHLPQSLWEWRVEYIQWDSGSNTQWAEWFDQQNSGAFNVQHAA